MAAGSGRFTTYFRMGAPPLLLYKRYFCIANPADFWKNPPAGFPVFQTSAWSGGVPGERTPVRSQQPCRVINPPESRPSCTVKMAS